MSVPPPPPAIDTPRCPLLPSLPFSRVITKGDEWDRRGGEGGAWRGRGWLIRWPTKSNRFPGKRERDYITFVAGLLLVVWERRGPGSGPGKKDNCSRSGRKKNGARSAGALRVRPAIPRNQFPFLFSGLMTNSNDPRQRGNYQPASLFSFKRAKLTFDDPLRELPGVPDLSRSSLIVRISRSIWNGGGDTVERERECVKEAK